MAIKFPKLLNFSNLDAKSRVFILLTVVIGIGFLVFVGIRFFGGGSTTGSSRVASAPAGLQSVPGSQVSPEYYRALMQANVQASQKAKMTGGSSVPTLVNVPGQQSGFPQSGNCTVLCPGDENANVADDINDLVRSGNLSQDDANALLDLAKNNVTVDEYAAALDELVKQGKLTPEQARQLLDRYKKQHDNSLLTDSAKAMDPLIKSGQLPLSVANELLALQKRKLTPAEYAAELNRLVREGKISPALAAQLLAQYTQQHSQELAKQGDLQLKQMLKNGQVTPEVAKDLSDLQKQNIPVEQYAAELQRLVAAGKLTPEAAAKLLDQYKKQKAGLGPADTLSNLVNQAQTAATSQIADLLKSGKISQETADALLALQNKDVSPEDYEKALSELVKAGKISPEEAQRLLDAYKKLHNVKAEAQRLIGMQGNNVSADEYANELKRAVQAGLITPEAAANLLQQYQAVIAGPGTVPTAEANIPGAEDFAKLQQRLQAQQGQAPIATGAGQQQFAAAASEAEAAALKDRQQRIQDMQAAMSSQAQQLISTAWAVPKMQHQGGSAVEEKKPGAGGAQNSTSTSSTTTSTTTTKHPLVKAGTIMFAVLDTTVDSDYPDTPVLATIIQGKLKGAKLLGKLSLPQGMDKVTLTFNLLDMESWPATKAVNAFAIDPDTARTALASEVNHHYLMRYGSLFASSFLTGYANAISNAGATKSTGIFGTTTTTSTLSPGNKIAVGLGQVGTAFTSAIASYVNTPNTVKVNSGVGLGILFMADVPE